MARFIPLSTFKSLYSSQSDLLAKANYEAFQLRLKSGEVEVIYQSSGFSEADFQAFLKSVSNPANIVFYGWVEQSNALNQFLAGGEIVKYEDKNKYLEHLWAADFRKFISPYVAHQLLRNEEKKKGAIEAILSFTKLLSEDDQRLLEPSLIKPLEVQLEPLQASDTITKETELITLVKPLCSPEIIRSINELSKASYQFKLKYVDTLLHVMRSPACTPRFANWILKQLETVQLNSEHQQKLIDLKAELKRGELKVRNHGEGKTPIQIKKLMFTAVALTLMLFAIWIVVYQPSFISGGDDEGENASFKELSDDQVRQLDSLLLIMQLNDNDIVVDDYRGIDLDPHTGFDNRLMESIYLDYSADIELKENFGNGDCKSISSVYKPYQGVQSLENKQGMQDAKLFNDSEYAIIVYVAEAFSDGAVYAVLLNPEDEIHFKLNEDDIITTVVGRQYQRFVLPSGASSNQSPSSEFKYHFCETDYNYAESLNASIQVVDISESVQIVVQGTWNSFYRMISNTGATQSY